MSQFAADLGQYIAAEETGLIMEPARVVDETGLVGEYDLTLRFSFHPRLPMLAMAARGDQASEPDGGGASLFGALESQLGLRLEKSKTALDVLVIDHAEKVPTEN